ncbi:MAG: antitoxin Xre/MbcA/ParS toxin-binding domain-containing protein [Burkholderiaceae bacterium]
MNLPKLKISARFAEEWEDIKARNKLGEDALKRARETASFLNKALNQERSPSIKAFMPHYSVGANLDLFVRVVNSATPMQLLEMERRGVSAKFLSDIAQRMNVSYSHLAEKVGIPKATAARKLAKDEPISGTAAIALARLLAIANEIVEDSTAAEAKKFDTAKWLGLWIERPQPALGGRKPSELLDTPTGVAMVTKVLGAIRSGAYQ